MTADLGSPHRVLVVAAGGSAAHEALRKVLAPDPTPAAVPHFELEAVQGIRDVLERLHAAVAENRPYSLVFVDLRRPKESDGVSIAQRLLQEIPELQVVLCHEPSDDSREQLIAQLGQGDRWILLKTPFDPLELRQLAGVLGARARAERDARSARDEAATANRAKSEFLSRVSHELRTPMNAILGFAQLLELEENLGAEAREHLQEILGGGRHLLELINEVLDLSRIESDFLTLTMEPVSIPELVAGSLTHLRPLAEGRGLTLDAIPDSDRTWHVLADRQRLAQVLLNVLSNAILYNRRGGTVTVEYAPIASPASSDLPPAIRLSVRDTGPGLDAMKLARLFTPFDRLDAERTHRRSEGVGLGLALSKRLIELMGGVLGVNSVPGEGSTFWFELPVAETLGTHCHRIDGLQRAEVEGHALMRTVVYISDELSDLKLVERILGQRSGLKLLVAIGGPSGSELVREASPDLVLLDLDLLDSGSGQVLASLQSESTTRNIPVVAIGGCSPSERADQFCPPGIRATLSKPLDVSAFLGVLDELLEVAD